MIWFVIAIVLLIIAIYLHKSADKIDSQYSSPPPSFSPSPVVSTHKKTYWDIYKDINPTKASDIEGLLKIDFSKISEKDVKEKIASIDRFAKSLKCGISQVKTTYLAEIEKYPAELIPQMIESTSKGIAKEASVYNVAQANTISAMMIAWLKERHEQLGRPDAKINAPSTNDEMEIVKTLNPRVTGTADLRERLKSLREMSSLYDCPMGQLREYYINDVKKNYDGKYENFHYLPEAYKYMAHKAYKTSTLAGVNPDNTSYGIMCDWLSDLMIEERERFLNSGQVKCIMCGSRNIKLSIFKDYFVCNSCNQKFGGL